MSAPSFIGLISATETESRLVLKNLNKTEFNGFYAGKFGNRKIILSVSGMGKTNAAHAATLMIERFSPALIVNFGIGGAYPSSGLRIGDIAVADTEMYGDEGIWLKDGFHTAASIGIPFLKKGRGKFFNEIPLDKKLVGKAFDICKRQLYLPTPPLPRGGYRGVIIKSGTFVTVSAATGTNKRARELENRFKGICENMEGAAVAHVCVMYGMPALEIRGISNMVEDRDRRRWDIKRAAENCQRALLGFLPALE